MMILNYVLQDDCALLPVEWDCFSGDENADVDWSKSGAVHFVEDIPWRRWKITHLASDLVGEWWNVAERTGFAATCRGFRGCRNRFDWAWRRLAFLFLKRNQWILRLHFRLWLHLRSTRGVDASPAPRRSPADVLHVVPGLAEPANGIAVAARLIAAAQNADIVEARWFAKRGADLSQYREVWVHSCWTPMVWKSCRRVLRAGKPLVRMTHANYAPARLRFGALKKRLAAPVERFFLRKAARAVATCASEVEWISAYEKRVRKIETIDLKKFFKLDAPAVALPPEGGRPLHVLYLGRRHPLKGIEYLESAAKGKSGVELRIASDAAGEEKEKLWEWCDALVLPTLNENFGLVVAEALERGKRAIVTDGAPVWMECGDFGGRLVCVKGFCSAMPSRRAALLADAISQIRRGQTT